MKYRDFQKTDIFKDAGIVICKRKGQEVTPRPLDIVISAYPVILSDFPCIKTIQIELL